MQAADIVRRIAGNPLGGLLGFEVLRAEPDDVVLRMPFRHQHTTLGDQVHGGAIAALIDTAATAVAWSGVDLANPPSRGTTVNLEVNYLAPSRATALEARASVPKRGRSLCFCQVDVFDEQEQLVSQGRAVYKIG